MFASAKRALEMSSDHEASPMRPLAPPAGGTAAAHEQTPSRQDASSVKQRVKELEALLEKAREELKESEAEKFAISTPTTPKEPTSAEDELGADDMVKSPGVVEPPPGMHADADREDHPEEAGRSSKDGHDPMQEARNDDWAKAKDRETQGKGAPDWIWEMIIQ